MIIIILLKTILIALMVKTMMTVIIRKQYSSQPVLKKLSILNARLLSAQTHQ